MILQNKLIDLCFEFSGMPETPEHTSEFFALQKTLKSSLSEDDYDNLRDFIMKISDVLI